MRRIIQGLVIVGITLATQHWHAVAQQYDCGDVEECARVGTELFQAERFLEAALVLEYAYQLEPVDVLLYNIARAYQRGNRCVRSSPYFLRYLDSGDTQARDQAMQHEPGQTDCAERYHRLILQAEEAISAGTLERAGELLVEARDVSDEPESRLLYLQTLLEQGQTDTCQAGLDFITRVEDIPDYSQEQRDELQRGRERAQACLAQADREARRIECEAEAERLDAEWRKGVQTQRMIGYIVAGAGVAVLAGALIHDIMSQGTIDDYETAAAEGDVNEYNSLRDDISSAKTLSIILYAAGGATTIAGIIVWLTAGGSPPSEDIDCTNVSWDIGYGLPTGDAGLWFRGVF